ncbi:MAG: hypothetical protein V2A73_19900 [Pseudomonadota bacterium]
MPRLAIVLGLLLACSSQETTGASPASAGLNEVTPQSSYSSVSSAQAAVPSPGVSERMRGEAPGHPLRGTTVKNGTLEDASSMAKTEQRPILPAASRQKPIDARIEPGIEPGIASGIASGIALENRVVAEPIALQQKEGQGYRITVKRPATTVKPNSPALVRVNIAPTAGYHLNKEFPSVLKIKAPPGVRLVRDQITPAEAQRFEEAGADLEVGFTAETSGSKHFDATLKFAVCTATTCEPKRETLAWDVNVE